MARRAVLAVLVLLLIYVRMVSREDQRSITPRMTEEIAA